MSPIDQQLNFASGKLISISEAAQNTPYTAEYLTLLARKGKLKAVKISRDWLTTREAVLEYVRDQAIKHKKMLNSLESVHFGPSAGPLVKMTAARVRTKKDSGIGIIPPSVGERGIV